MTTFATALRHYRTRAGWSLTKLGVEAGVYHQAIMRYERGVKHPRRETVEALAEALDLSPLDADLERDRLLLAAGYAPHDLAGMVLAACERLGAISDDDNTRWCADQAAWHLRMLITRLDHIPAHGDLNALCREVAP